MLKVKLSKDSSVINKDIKALNMYKQGMISFTKLKVILSANNKIYLDDDDVKKLIALGYKKPDEL